MAKQTKKDKKKRLKSLVLLLFLTIVLLSTSTYAWFTANRSVSIDPINVNIAASSGIQISTDASNWKTVISNTDITSATYNSPNTVANQLPSILAPVSTAGIANTTTGRLNFYKGEITADPAINSGLMSLSAVATPAEAHGTSGDYIAFDIYLKVDQDNSVIYLENGSGVKSTSGYTDKGLQYASRYAFVIEGTVADNGSAQTTAQALHAANPIVIVEPNFDSHNPSGITNAKTYYNQGDTSIQGNAGPNLVQGSGNPAVPYVGVKAAISASSPIVLKNTNPGGTPDSDVFASIQGLKKTNTAYSDADPNDYEAYSGNAQELHLLPVFTINQGITKIRVYMWIEGQDIDCENSASGAYLTYKLGFTLDDDE